MLQKRLHIDIITLVLLLRSILSYRYTARHYRNDIDMQTTVTIQRKSRIKIYIMTDISLQRLFLS